MSDLKAIVYATLGAAGVYGFIYVMFSLSPIH